MSEDVAEAPAERYARHSAAAAPGVRTLLRALRPKQWLKNLLVFAAPLAAGSLLQGPVLIGTLVAFVVFCLAASATYLINDIRDAETDRRHPTKRFRPIASGAVSPTTATVMAIVLMAVALGVGFWQSPDWAGRSWPT